MRHGTQRKHVTGGDVGGCASADQPDAHEGREMRRAKGKFLNAANGNDR
jgi:hypothetical protein